MALSNQAFPALSVNPLDVAGAGDSLLALFATGLASGQEMMPTAALACCMAALAVETMGNTPISATALRSNVAGDSQAMSQPKILVIGSNSFSGSHFVAEALSAGHEVWGVSRSTEPNTVFLLTGGQSGK